MEIFLGFVLGIIGTILFELYRVNVKSKIDISKNIAYIFDNDKYIFKIKLCNLTNRLVTDLEYYSSVCTLKEIPNGSTTVGMYWPKSRKDKHLFLGKNNKKGKVWDLSPIYYISFEVTPEMFKEIKKGMKFLFTISFVDALSGTKDVKRIAYDFSDLISGTFQGVDSMDIQALEQNNPVSREN